MSYDMIKLDDLCHFITDGTHQTPKYCEKGVIFLSSKNVTSGKIDWDNTKFISEELHEDIKRNFTPQAGDILLAKNGTTGVAAIVDRDCVFSIYVSLAILRPKIEHILPEYLLAVVNSPLAKRQFNSHLKGVGVKNLHLKDIRNCKIPLPPLNIQKKIEDILDRAQKLIDTRKEQITEMDSLIQSLFYDMFGDPVGNPMGFPSRNLPDLYISKKEGTRCGPFGSALKRDEFVDTGIPVWNMDNISLKGHMVLPFRMWITEEKFQKLEGFSVKDGDVLISRAGTVGKMCVAKTGEIKSIISTNLIRVRFGSEILPLYFVSLMNYCKGRIGRLKTGPDGAFTHMNTGVLDTLSFPLPPIDLQKTFADSVQKIEAQKAAMTASLSELEDNFNALMQKAFKGELV